MPDDTKPSVRAGNLLGLTLFYTAFVMSSMLFICFENLEFTHVMVLQLPSVFVPILILTALFTDDFRYITAGGFVLLTAAYETGYGLWLISASSIVRVSMAETEEIVGLTLLVGTLIMRLLFLYTICVSLWNLYEVPLHERFAMKKADLKQNSEDSRPYGGPWSPWLAFLKTQMDIFSAYITWLIAVTIALELELLMISFADLEFLSWHLPLFYLISVPCLAISVTFKNYYSMSGINTIVVASAFLLGAGFLWVIIASITHHRIREWTVIVFLVILGLHFCFTILLSYNIQLLESGGLDFKTRARWWKQK